MLLNFLSEEQKFSARGKFLFQPSLIYIITYFVQVSLHLCWCQMRKAKVFQAFNNFLIWEQQLHLSPILFFCCILGWLNSHAHVQVMASLGEILAINDQPLSYGVQLPLWDDSMITKFCKIEFRASLGTVCPMIS